ncbi:RHS repeat-associated core domain-containing protein [Asticcacaulis taihuensis]|uniref:RHS repeat-associated core domain-containing protein n=1 Tax=Asticcacaulis taihuensis TaxID=260084 RepID=UPI0026EDC001|nr:RHS repeat-associated core domain-containing protein [Asticcacaulis taihuensis]
MTIKRNIAGTIAALLGLAGFNAVRADTVINVTQYAYNYNNQLVCTAVRMNMAITQPADACAPATTVGGNGPDRITQNNYDQAGQLLAVYKAVGTSSVIQYAYYNYTPNGKKAFEIDANHNKTTFTYDVFDRLSKIQYPNTTVGNETSSTTDYESFGYDPNGNRTSWRRRDGNTIAYAFDALNHQTYEGGDAVADMRTAYDLQGHVLSKHFTSGDIGVDYAYDGLGRVMSTTDMMGRTVNYSYNSASGRTKLIFPDGTYVQYTLDNLNRVSAAGLNGTSNVLFGQVLDSLGRRKTLSRGISSAGGATTYGYDNLGRLTSLTNNLSGTAYDITWTFSGYNAANQITTWGASSTVYDYVETATATTAKTYDGLNRDAAIAAISGGYDSKGNLAKDGTRTMTYDIYNRLLTVTGTGMNLKLVYDTEGRLAKYSSDGGTTYTTYLYDGTSLIGEYVGATMTHRYVHGPGTDEPLVWYQGSGVTATEQKFLYQNYQGSVVAYTDSAGVLVEYYKYGPYGEPRNASNAESWGGSHFKYTGQTALGGSSGLYYYKARVYDPTFGRFLQTDPVGSKDDLDLYAYTGGDPINKTDPSGNCVEDLCIGEAAAVGWCVAGGCEAASLPLLIW